MLVTTPVSGRTVLPLEDALRFIATEDIFWALV